MVEKIDLKEIEKKAYKATLQDGLIDIEMGIVLIGMGINSAFYDLVPRLMNLLGILIVGIIAVTPLFLGKKYIVSPRIGIIKFGPKRKAQKKKIIIFTLINTLILVIVLILTVTSVLQQIPLQGPALLLILGLVFATLPLSIMAYLMQFPRFYIYGLLIGFGIFFAEVSYLILGDLGWSFTFILIGTAILLVGLAYLVKFLLKYPLPEKEVQ